MSPAPYDVEGRTIAQLEADLAAGRVTSAGLVDAYAARIAHLDRDRPNAPGLHAVLAIAPEARHEAEASDARRGTGAAPRPLEGIPILVKDNIETAGALPTTAGSLALLDNVSGQDSDSVRRLRAAGAVILGKTNLSEWANSRSAHSTSGWSGVGGLTRNPHALDRTACGSSSGSGVAVAVSFAAAAIGTETDGSIVCPASMNGIVGLKPTVGLVSRARVVPISASQDTPGPMTRTVADAALLLSVMAGSDAADPATAPADAHLPPASIAPGNALAGARIGVLALPGQDAQAIAALFHAALDTLRARGATVVDAAPLPDADAIGAAEAIVLRTEFKAGLDAYLAATPKPVATRSMADVIAFNIVHADRELGLFGQDQLIASEAAHGLDDPAYLHARDNGRRLAGPEGILRLLAAQKLDALVAVTAGPAWLVDPVLGDSGQGPSASTLPAVAGLPHLTVPMGAVDGLPVGLSLIGPAWSEPHLLALGAAFERARPPPPRPVFAPTAGTAPATAALLSPVEGRR